MRRVLVPAVLAGVACGEAPAEPVPEEPACATPLCNRVALDALGVDLFYEKYIDPRGIPVISSERVKDRALLVAKEIVEEMLACRDDVLEAMQTRGAHVGIMSRDEVTTDIPEHRHLANDPTVD